MLPKLLMNGIKLKRVAPNQEQGAHQQDIPYKVKYRCKFCEMLCTVQIFQGSEMRVSGSEFRTCGASTLTSKQKGAMVHYIDDAEARSVSWCALERTLLFINFLLCALKFQHICVNNCKSTYSASIIWLKT